MEAFLPTWKPFSRWRSSLRAWSSRNWIQLQQIPHGVTFLKSSFKVQSSKLELLLLLKRGKRNVRALSFQLWNSFRKCHPKWDMLLHRILKVGFCFLVLSLFFISMFCRTAGAPIDWFWLPIFVLILFVAFRIRRWNFKIREQFRYKLLPYEWVNPAITISLLHQECTQVMCSNKEAPGRCSLFFLSFFFCCDETRKSLLRLPRWARIKTSGSLGFE